MLKIISVPKKIKKEKKDNRIKAEKTICSVIEHKLVNPSNEGYGKYNYTEIEVIGTGNLESANKLIIETSKKNRIIYNEENGAKLGNGKTYIQCSNYSFFFGAIVLEIYNEVKYLENSISYKNLLSKKVLEIKTGTQAKGGYGKIYFTKQGTAVKALCRDFRIKGENEEMLLFDALQEANWQKKLGKRNENLLGLISVGLVAINKRITLLVEMEKMDSDIEKIAKFAKDKESLSSLVSSIIKQILNGLRYIHEKQLIFLDMKPKNILKKEKAGTKELRFKICDYGSLMTKKKLRKTLKKYLKGKSFEKSKKDKFCKDVCSITKHYAAPELNTVQTEQDEEKVKMMIKSISEKLDIWAFGISLIEVINQKIIPELIKDFGHKLYVNTSGTVSTLLSLVEDKINTR